MFTVLKGFRYKLARNRREICWNERDGMGDGVKAREREIYIYRESDPLKQACRRLCCTGQISPCAGKPDEGVNR